MAFTEKRKNGYMIRCNCGYDNKGKRIVHSKAWIPPAGLTPRQIKKELAKAVMEFQEECESGRFETGKITFAQYAAEWKQYAENNLRMTTYARYCGLLERIVAALGKKRLSDIKPGDLYAFYDSLRDEQCSNLKCTPKQEAMDISRTETRIELAEHTGISVTTIDCVRAGKTVSMNTAERIANYFGRKAEELFDVQTKTLSDRTILHHHRLISSIMQSAVYDGIIDSNPCFRTRAPKVATKEARYLNDSEAQLLIETVREKAPHPYDVIVYVLLLTGMRRGECCGLNWSDIDFDNCTISISRSLCTIPGKGIFESDPKTFSSNRIIKVDPDLLEILKEHKKRQDMKAKDLGNKWNKSDKIFTASDGKMINPDTVSSWFNGFVAENDLPSVCLHSLRHTCASLMISRGIPITTTAKRLGHSTSVTTAKIYAHAIAEADAAAAEMLHSVLPLGSIVNQDSNR